MSVRGIRREVHPLPRIAEVDVPQPAFRPERTNCPRIRHGLGDRLLRIPHGQPARSAPLGKRKERLAALVSASGRRKKDGASVLRVVRHVARAAQLDARRDLQRSGEAVVPRADVDRRAALRAPSLIKSLLKRVRVVRRITGDAEVGRKQDAPRLEHFVPLRELGADAPCLRRGLVAQDALYASAGRRVELRADFAAGEAESPLGAHRGGCAAQGAGVEHDGGAEILRAAHGHLGSGEDRVVAREPHPVEIVELERHKAVRDLAARDDGVRRDLRLLEAYSRRVAAHLKPAHELPVAAPVRGPGRAA